MSSLPRLLCAVLSVAVSSTAGSATTFAAPSTRADTAATIAARAREAYEAGRFREAITLYEEAHAREANPTLLFNMGRCFEALATADDLTHAIEKYEAYLRGVPGAGDRAAVERRIEALREQIRVMQRAAAPPPLAPPPPVASPMNEPEAASPWPWVVAGGGAGGIVSGIVLGVIAKGEHDAAVESRSGSEAMDHASRADGLGVAATVAYVAGGVICAAGVTWGIVDVVTRKDAAYVPMQIRVGITGATVVGRF